MVVKAVGLPDPLNTLELMLARYFEMSPSVEKTDEIG